MLVIHGLWECRIEAMSQALRRMTNMKRPAFREIFTTTSELNKTNYVEANAAGSGVRLCRSSFRLHGHSRQTYIPRIAANCYFLT